MNNKRRHTLCILILIMTSLFLSSCGEPSLCTLSGISITKQSISDEKKVSVKISGSDTDLSKLTSGPGVLLCYAFGSVTMDPDEAKTPFANLVKTKLIIDYDDNSSILTFGSDNTVLYAFSKNESGTGRISSPDYCYNLFSDISGTSLNKTLTLEYKDGRKFTLDDAYDFYTKTLPTDTTATPYIYIYAAFSAEQGSFSNNYWSSLINLGRIEIITTE